MKTTWSSVLIAILMAPLLAHTTHAKEPAKKPQQLISTELSGRDVKFLRDINVSLNSQKQIASLTASKAKKQKIADFAGNVDRELSKELDTLREVAKQQGMILPDKLPDAERAKIEGFSTMESPEIDVAFLEELIRSRTEQIPIFEDAAVSQVKPIQAFAMEAMNAVKEHLLYVQTLTKEGMDETAATSPVPEATPEPLPETAPTPGEMTPPPPPPPMPPAEPTPSATAPGMGEAPPPAETTAPEATPAP